MNKIILFALVLMMSSCTLTNYYQVFKTDTNNGFTDGSKLYFEDNNCIVYYNLWNVGGNVGFSIYNKTEDDLTLHLNRSFFVLNGIANEYYKNRIFSKSSNVGSATTTYNYNYSLDYIFSRTIGTNSAGISTSFIEKPELRIPSKTMINISEYIVTNERYVSCDLLRYPTKKEIKSLRFNENNSPFVFYNLITYSSKIDTTRFENKFYVNEITNYPQNEVLKLLTTSECGKPLSTPIKVFKDASPDKFYIRYIK